MAFFPQQALKNRGGFLGGLSPESLRKAKNFHYGAAFFIIPSLIVV
jgi:hypothetical protein